MSIEHTPVITATELSAIVDRIEAIWRLEEHRAAVPRDVQGSGLRIIKVRELMSRAPSTRLENVRDASSGLRYSVWLAGETIARLAGLDAVHSAYGLFERRHGTRASAWLNSAWNGVSDGVAVWSA